MPPCSEKKEAQMHEGKPFQGHRGTGFAGPPVPPPLGG